MECKFLVNEIKEFYNVPLIEPEWNVNPYKIILTHQSLIPLIEPEWNVNISDMISN